MRKMRHTVVLSAVFAAVALCAGAKTVTWTNVASRTGWWSTANNWTDGTEIKLKVAPTNGEDIAFITTGDRDMTSVFTGPSLGTDGRTYITNSTSVDPTVGIVAGPNRYFIRHGGNVAIGSGAVNNSWQHYLRRTFTIGDSTGFLGYWNLAGTFSEFNFDITNDTDVTYMTSLSSSFRGVVTVTNAGTKAVVDELHGRGLVQKEGEGILSLGATDGAECNVNHYGGVLELRGSADGDDELARLMEEAAVHVDASAAWTLSTVEDGGRCWVTNWADVRGNGYSLVAPTFAKPGDRSYFGFSNPGYVTTNDSPIGMPMVSFGAPYPGWSGHRYSAEDGPTNCCLDFAFGGKAAQLGNVREIAYAARYPYGATYCTLFGGPNDWQVLNGEQNKMFETWDTFPKTAPTAERVKPLVMGEMRLNGEPFLFDQVPAGDLAALSNNVFAASLALSIAVPLQSLGTDRYYAARSGGTRIGEALFFTNELTRAQRLKLNVYLYNKWVVDGAGECDVGNLLYDERAKSVSVPAGRTATVRTITSHTKTVEKSGGGTLRFENFVGDVDTEGGTSMVVHGGAVGIASLAGEVTTNAPAADPHIWLDAEKGPFTTIESALYPGVTFVTNWWDCRGINRWAYSGWTYNNTPLPITEVNRRIGSLQEFKGRQVIDLGRYRSGSLIDAADYLLPDWRANLHRAYAVFVVSRPNLMNTEYPIFGAGSNGSASDLYKGGSYDIILSQWAAMPSAHAATFTRNGVQVDPREVRAEYGKTNSLSVMAFSSDGGANVNSVGIGHGGQYVGRGQFAEVLVYHRPLSEKERRNTEAYLMAKWLGRRHPEAAAREVSVYSLKFDDGVPVKFDSQEAMRVKSLVGGNGEFVKSGAGAVKVDYMNSAMSNLTVTAGKLSARLDGDWVECEAVLHFDASDETSLSAYESADEETGLTSTYVTEWADCRGNGLWARSSAHEDISTGSVANNCVCTNPVLRTVEMRPGISRVALDFGQGRHFYATTGGGSDRKKEPWHDEASMMFNRRVMAAEVYTVVAWHTNVENRTGSSYVTHRGRIIGGQTGAYHFGSEWSNASEKMFENNQGSSGVSAANKTLLFSSKSGETHTWLDGAVASGAAADMPPGFHLVAVATSNAVPGEVSAFAQNYNLSAGGVLIAEQIGFGRWLTDAERAELRARLMYKWFGEGTSPSAVVRTNEFQRLSVAAGAEFEVRDSTVLKASSYSGGGRITASELTGVSYFDLTGRLTVSGRLVFADEVTVNIDSGFAFDHDGVYPVISAGEYGPFDISRWKLTGAALPKNKVTFLTVAEDGTICVRIVSKGMLIKFK